MNDIKFGIRQLIRSPGFTVVAVVSLALGIGANTAIFSLINSMLLKSLPVHNAHELRCIHWTSDTNLDNVTVSGSTESMPSGQIRSNAFSHAAYQALRDHGSGLSDVFALSLAPRLTVIAQGTARTADGLTVSGNFFEGLGVNPLLGRTIAPQDDRSGAEPVAVLSYAGWQEHFAGDLDALGQTITLNDCSYTVIGVLAQGFDGVLGHSRTDVYVPLASRGQLQPDFSLESPGNWGIQIMARLAPNADERQVRAGLDVLFHRSIRPNQFRKESRPPQILLRDGRRGFADARGRHTQPLFILMAIVGIVLFVACINLAGLLLARGATREHELAVRTALGAQRHHLLRQSLTESLLIVLAGAGAGCLIGTWGKAILARLLLPPNMPVDVGSDVRVFGFTLGVSILAVGLFGLIPALRATRANPMGSLKDRSSLGTPRLRLGRFLVATQVALCLLLLVGAGLFTRSLINLRNVDVGFKTENLLTFQVNARNGGYEGTRLVDFCEQLEERIAALPGVQATASSNIELLSGWRSETMMIVPNRPDQVHILRLNVSDSFLSTMGIPLLAGRGFNHTDAPESAKVIVVNQTLAKSTFPDEDPIGRSVIINRKNYRIVGICSDTKYYDIKVPTEPAVFFSARQHPDNTRMAYYHVRTALDPLSLVPAIRRALADLDPKIPIAKIKTQTMQLNESIAQERLFAALGSALALLAVLLACIGLYGLLAYNVTRRRSEMGIRMALGATPQNVAWPILRSALITACAGIALGLPIALAIVRIVRTVLFGVEPYDPATVIGAVILLLAVATLAAWIPARRAAKIDPMEALRYE
jgi:predicted permease